MQARKRMVQFKGTKEAVVKQLQQLTKDIKSQCDLIVENARSYESKIISALEQQYAEAENEIFERAKNNDEMHEELKNIPSL